METVVMPPQEALGSLNEVEKKNAPERLYLAGNVDLLRSFARVSLVGSRKASNEGLRRARSLAKILVENDVVIVSGLAEGVDTVSHEAAIAAGGYTVAVLGTPLEKSYPASNKELQREIAENHLLVSQFAPGYPGGRKNFPMRNRTMAMISDATVIIEAADGSGTIHQGYEALRLGRPLFLLESIVQNEELTWPKEMLSYGARVLNRENLDELLELLPRVSRDELAAFAF